MDAKALAKSKRAHSLHHSKKHHPDQISKAAVGSVTSTSGKKQTNKQERDKQHQSRVSKALPSNWDRYEEEFDSVSEDSPHVSTSQPSDAIAPKSKGAHFTYLISEAKAQPQANSNSFTLFDDVLEGFNQGLGPLLSVKGQQMLSWISDDNFSLDDKGAISREASFLSLNLHLLAEQLSKANLAERLFIEPDLLPPELCTELHASDAKTPDEAQAIGSTEAIGNVLVGQAPISTSEEKANIHISREYVSSNSSKSSHISAPISVNHPVDDLWQINETSGSTSEKLTSDVYADSVPTKPSRFEAMAAEAELDMLLDSFSDTKFFDSTSLTKQSSHTFYEPLASSNQSDSFPVQHDPEGPDLTYFGKLNASQYDNFDDLFQETSQAINTKGLSPLHEVKAAPDDAPSASQPHSKSKVLDDFDSWLDTI